jgi:hypothetical protein
MILLVIGATLSTATALMHQLERDRAQGGTVARGSR